ncbi:hypothetical protein ARMGADRAFT_945276 [Armillaria gallica]|uniref:CxC2-like cysteine cluster KDZ transposase-associated domain-containing protein n=1 Tax=Armillaria gallica TaxID=47427 RepID=A0A2H3CN09_ARMGA|nr:hypothetical protein ARMGADRAFT_945276 [Armillaria gallica]
MVWEWCHLKLLKQQLAKSPCDFKDTLPGKLPVTAGSLAVKCLACPWPGINLDEGWENDTNDLWKYTPYLAIDANFQLVCFMVSNSNRDPSLTNRVAFIVWQDEFREHVAEYGKWIPFDPRLATSGIATVDCACHDCKNPSVVTILDHGKEQVHIDYIFCGCLQHPTPHCVVVSYDINCQRSKKLWDRMDIYPVSMRHIHIGHDNLQCEAVPPLVHE